MINNIAITIILQYQKHHDQRDYLDHHDYLDQLDDQKHHDQHDYVDHHDYINQHHGQLDYLPEIIVATKVTQVVPEVVHLAFDPDHDHHD